MASDPSSPWRLPSTEASREWARRGHASAELATVLSTRPPTPSAAPYGRRRFPRGVVGTAALLGMAVISAGSALAFRDALFPDTGDATTQSVWQNPGRPAAPAPESAAAPPPPTFRATTTSTADAGDPTPPVVVPLLPPVTLATDAPSTTDSASDATRPPTAATTVVVDPPRTTATTPSTTVIAATTTSSPGDAEEVASSTTAPDDADSDPTTGPASTTSTPDDTTPDSTEPDDTAPDSTGPSTTADVSHIEPFTKVYSADGGSITVTWDGSRLSLDAVNPTSGYTVEIDERSADHIRVEFEHGDNDESRIDVRIDHGEVRVEIE